MISTTTTTRQRRSFFLHSPPTCQSVKEEEALYAKTTAQKCSSSSSRTRNPKEREMMMMMMRERFWLETLCNERLFLVTLFLSFRVAFLLISERTNNDRRERGSNFFGQRIGSLSLWLALTQREEERVLTELVSFSALASQRRYYIIIISSRESL